MNLELKNGSPQKRLAGTGRHVNGKREYGIESNNHKNSGNTNRMTGKTSTDPPFAKGAKTATCKKMNIVVKALDPKKFLKSTEYMNRMLQDLRNDKILDDVIGLDIMGEVREYKLNKKGDQIKLIRPNISSYNVVPKGSYMYTLTLPDNHYLMLRHLGERWFRYLAYFSNHDSYSNFLNQYEENRFYRI